MKTQRIRIDRKDLGLILFWAGYGIGKAKGGHRTDRMLEIYERYRIVFQLPKIELCSLVRECEPHNCF